MRACPRIFFVMVMLIAFSLLLSNYVVSVHASEPSLTEIFTHLGFTHVAEVTVETFPLGSYNITLYAQFAQYYDENELSFYQVNTSNFIVIFTGPEGGFGYLPLITKTFAADYQFGLSLSHASPVPFRYFTETSRNPDGAQWAKIYKNLDDPSMFLIGFDERTYCDGTGDKDYNDMVFSLQLQYYLNVVSPYDTPSGEGWYYNGTDAFASLASGVVDHGNGTRRVFTRWSGDASGTNHSKSEPIYMNQNKTAKANWKTQYLLTVLTAPPRLSPQPTRNPADEAGPANGWWYDATTSVTLTAQTVTGYTFSHWNVDGTSQGIGVNPITVHMNSLHTATAHYTQIPPLSASISPTPARIKIGESVTFTSLVSGGKPPYYYQWYQNGSAVSSATSPTWTFTPGTTGSYTVYLIVTDSLENTTKSNEASVAVAPQLTVSISPTSASIIVGQSVDFTSKVSGGYPPYSYQWYLNGNPVSGATSTSWTFTPTTTGIHYVYLKVTDADNNTVQSETARVTVTTVPVGGYSISAAKQTPTSHITAYTALIALFGAAVSLTKRKRK